MEIRTEALRQTRATRLPPRKTSDGEIARRLERYGWRREVAGDDDFNTAVKAIVAMYETGRGLLISGHAGCGKTHLMNALRKNMGVSAWSWIYCKEPYDINMMRDPRTELLDTSVFVDDIGAEEIQKEYGNTIDAVGDFVQRYYYRGRGRFLATTNLDGNGLNSIYGLRVVDRLSEMCVILNLKGKSKRERIVF